MVSNHKDSVQIIELTSKAIKANLLLSALLMVISIAGFFQKDPAPYAPILFTIGFFWHIGARVYRWWRHG